MRQQAVTCTAVVLTLALSLSGAQALDLVELKQAPSCYATGVGEMDQGQPVPVTP